VIETVLLYNAESWTLTATLEQKLDSAHAGLLRATFRVDADASSHALYQRLRLERPSAVLRRRRVSMAGHVLRAEAYGCRMPVQETLLLTLQGPRRRGQARSRSYVDCLLDDLSVGDVRAARLALMTRGRST
jgi:hypothetical protein